MQSFFAENELMKNLMKIFKLRAILEQFKAKFRQRKMKNSCGKFNIHFVTRARIVFSARKFFSRKNHFFHYPRKPFHQFKKIFFDQPYDTNAVIKCEITEYHASFEWCYDDVIRLKVLGLFQGFLRLNSTDMTVTMSMIHSGGYCILQYNAIGLPQSSPMA